MTPRRLTRTDTERGSAAIEIAVLTPILLLVLAFAVYAGRYAHATTTVDQAAYAGARAASIARTPAQARIDARNAVDAALTQSGTTCASLSVTIDTHGFASPMGTPAATRVTITCTIPIRDLTLPGIGGSRAVTGTATSSIDNHRARGTS